MDTIGIIAAIAGSGSIGALINAFFSREKNKTEIEAVMGGVYGRMIDDCRSQLTHQAGQISMQANLILQMQERENNYLIIIAEHKKIEMELRTQIKDLEKKLGTRIKSLEEQSPLT